MNRTLFTIQFKWKLISILTLVHLVIFSGVGYVSYTIHMKLFNEETSKQYQKTNEQVMARLDARINDVYRISNYINFSPTTQGIIRSKQTWSDLLDKYVYSQKLNYEFRAVLIEIPEILGVALYDLNENGLSIGNIAVENVLPAAVLPDIKSSLTNTAGELVWMKSHITDAFAKGGSREVYVASRWIKASSLETYGMMVIVLDASFFYHFLQSLISEKGEVHLLDEAGRELFSDRHIAGSLTEGSRQAAAYKANGIEADSKDFITLEHVSGFTGYRLITRLSTEDVQQGSRILFNIALISACISIVISAFFIIWTSESMLKPLKTLMSGMKRVREGDLDTRIHIQTRDELSFIGESFNAMTENIERLIKEVYQRQLSETQAELKAIQAQLNPHFLNNTLDMFFWRFYKLNDEESAKLIVSLSNMLQYTLERVDRLSTMGEEIRHVNNYLLIQQARQPKGLITKVEIDEQLIDSPMIRLLLQPIVENAFIHGFKNMKSDKHLTIHAYQTESMIVVTITDNGCGIEQKVVDAVTSVIEPNPDSKRYSLGIRSVIRRIELMYGAPYGLSIASSVGQGTCVTIKLPILGDLTEVMGIVRTDINR